MTPLLGCHLRCPNRGIVQASSDAGFAQPFATKGNPERAPRTPGGTHRSKWWPRDVCLAGHVGLELVDQAEWIFVTAAIELAQF